MGKIVLISFSLTLLAVLAACAPVPSNQSVSAPDAGSARTGTASSPQAAQPPLVDWRDTVSLEDSDRENRFVRLATAGEIGTPEFYHYLISAKDLPPGFGVDIPVLRVVFPERVFFDTASSDLRPDAQPVLQLIAKTLGNDVPDLAVFVAGHTDSRGGDEYNYVLSVDRADSVAKALLQLGVGSTYHLWEIGFGKTVPLLPNTSAENMAQNRRVELLIAARPEAIAAFLSKFPLTQCGQVPDNMKSLCQTEVATLPPVRATPVLPAALAVSVMAPPTTSVPISPPGTTTSVSDATQAVKASSSSGSAVPIQPVRGTIVKVDPTATYVIHMNQGQYETVGVPHT